MGSESLATFIFRNWHKTLAFLRFCRKAANQASHLPLPQVFGYLPSSFQQFLMASRGQDSQNHGRTRARARESKPSLSRHSLAGAIPGDVLGLAFPSRRRASRWVATPAGRGSEPAAAPEPAGWPQALGGGVAPAAFVGRLRGSPLTVFDPVISESYHGFGYHFSPRG